jgi:CheY-like chemotaxis protein
MTSAEQPGGVLIVEDDAGIRETLAEILQEEGYQVIGVANGLEGINYLRSAAPTCIILLDLMMPVMNGWEFRSQQQGDPALARIPVVIISGDGNVQQKAASLNAAGYLSKPIDLDRLLATVAQHCGGALA